MIDFWFEQTQAEKQSVKTWVEGRIVANQATIFPISEQEKEDLLIQSVRDKKGFLC